MEEALGCGKQNGDVGVLFVSFLPLILNRDPCDFREAGLEVEDARFAALKDDAFRMGGVTENRYVFRNHDRFRDGMRAMAEGDFAVGRHFRVRLRKRWNVVRNEDRLLREEFQQGKHQRNGQKNRKQHKNQFFHGNLSIRIEISGNSGSFPTVYSRQRLGETGTERRTRDSALREESGCP